MISEIERLHSAAGDSAELRQVLQSVSSLDGFVTYAGSKGYDFSLDELKQWATKNGVVEGELSLADLDNVAGGRGPWSYVVYEYVSKIAGLFGAP